MNMILQKSWWKVSVVLPGFSQAGSLQQFHGKHGKPARSLLSAPHKGTSGLVPVFLPTALTLCNVPRVVSESCSPSLPKHQAAWMRRQVEMNTIATSGRSLTSPPGGEEGKKSLTPYTVNALLRRKLQCLYSAGHWRPSLLLLTSLFCHLCSKYRPPKKNNLQCMST